MPDERTDERVDERGQRSRFDAGGPLPSGVTALEASAGTGKTFVLSSLAARFIAEHDVPASALCIVSFTEAATAELRGRVRSRVVAALQHLSAGAPPVDDPVLTAIADTADDAERALRAHRLSTAINEFDAATISTIHGFCSRVLAGTGAGSDLAIDDGAGDVAEAVNDLVIARYGHRVPEWLKPTSIRLAVEARLAMPDVELWRPDPDAGSPKFDEPARRRRSNEIADFVDEVTDEVRGRRVAARRRTFDGLLSDTRDLLLSPAGVAARAALRARYRVVLIDEFQDTDRVQWDIFSAAFLGGESPATVVLVGDPKQSIYRFRGAELDVYLQALADADEVATLDTNWRSDARLLTGLERVLRGFDFGDPRVAFHSVRAAPHLERSRWSSPNAAHAAALELRAVQPSADGALSTDHARRVVGRDVVANVVSLLGAGITIDDDGAPPRPLRAKDIAILTRSNADANRLALDLGRAGVPAASASNNSVLDSEAAKQWRILLRALERPTSPGLARAAALGWFIGRTPVEVASFSDDDVAELHDVLREWSVLLAQRGVPALMAAARSSGLDTRRLARIGGERELTDLDHVAELLHAATRGRPVGAPALVAVLDSLVDPAGAEGEDRPSPDALARRIDRDDDAVQVLTVHKAKGLEFPVVLCPFHWTGPFKRVGPPHADAGAVREMDSTWVAGVGDLKWNAPIRDADDAERNGEERRLLYVALTRARHRCVVWYAPVSKKLSSGLSQVLAAATGSRGVPELHHLERLADADADGAIAVTPVPDTLAAVPRHESTAVEHELAVDLAVRHLDTAWRNWSFTGIKRVSEQFGHGDTSETETAGGADEPSGDLVIPETGESGGAPIVATAFAAAPGGTSLGTLVHEVLERVDFTSPSLDADLRAECEERLVFRTARVTADVLVEGLTRAIDAPLGGPVGATRLRDLSRADRLDELGFDLSLARFDGAAIGQVLARHLDQADALRPYFERMAHDGFRFPIDGLLNGSIDLVARTSDHLEDGIRYWLADYKTNQLGVDREYTDEAMVAAMTLHDYPLQAALYLVALHRYLRWRVPAYRPEQHLGGAAYLFLRGMDPARPLGDTRGVYWWRPPTEAVLALDRLLATGEPA